MFIEPGILLWLAVAFLLAGALFGWTSAEKDARVGSRYAVVALLLASVLTTVGAVGYWQNPMVNEYHLFTSVLLRDTPAFPPLEFSFRVDRLAAFMLILTGLISSAVAVYSLAWFEAEAANHKVPQHHTAGSLCLLVLFSTLLVLANNVFCFLLFLECITLAFGHLTLHRHRLLIASGAGQGKPETHELEAAKRAFKVYLVTSHAAILLVTAALLILALAGREPSLSFQHLRNWSAYGPLTAEIATPVFFLALAGFGIKSAVTPFHSWLPLAHPFLPTNVHALVSSVVIKVAGLYGLIRVLFEFLAPVSWWGGVLLLLSGLTALAGVFYAITSHDLKTALANHSIENIGIMLAGIGLALLLNGLAREVYQHEVGPGHVLPAASAVLIQAYRQVAVLALLASLYHMLNHAVFKALLFLGTGAIENRMHTVKLDELGGLISRHRYYVTTGTFLVGAVAIAGLPPFNGFVSEWLTLQSLFAALDVLVHYEPQRLTSDNLLIFRVSLVLLAAIIMLALAFGLTVLAFVKITGGALLGAPRNEAIAHAARSNRASDVPRPMGGTLLVLAITCLVLGVLPGLVASQLVVLGQDLAGTSMPFLKSGHIGEVGFTLYHASHLSGAAGGAMSVPTVPYSVEIQMLPLFVLLSSVVLVLFGLLNRNAHRRSVRREPWNGGSEYVPTRMQISDSAFGFFVSSSIKKQSREKQEHAWQVPMTTAHSVVDFTLGAAVKALDQITIFSARFGGWMQNGSIQRYLFYLFATFLVILFISVIWARQ